MKTKRNKILIIISAIAIFAATLFIILGFTIAGENVLAWFTSSWAYLIYSVVGVCLIMVIYFIVGDLIKKI